MNNNRRPNRQPPRRPNRDNLIDRLLCGLVTLCGPRWPPPENEEPKEAPKAEEGESQKEEPKTEGDEGNEYYGTPLFHDIDYHPVYTYSPFTPRPCTRTVREHLGSRTRYFVPCSNCVSRSRGWRTDDICHCSE
jgi:hypothetical protein